MRVWYHFFAPLMAALTAVYCTGKADAQTYPTKPIKIIVGYPAGAGPDVEVRNLLPQLTADLGHPVIIENRGGNGGLIGMELVAKAAPDGYTFGGGTISNLAVNPRLYDKPTFDLESLPPVSQYIRHPWLLHVSGTIPAKDLGEFIALAKSKPGSVAIASTGIGTAPHLSLELFQSITGTKFNHIPYGADPFILDLISGQVAGTFYPLITMTEQLKSGKTRGLAISNGGKRSELVPNVPQFSEVGMPEFDVTAWAGFVAPAGTPKEIIDRFASAAAKAAQSAEYSEYAGKNGATAVGSTPAEFGAFLKAERARWKKVIADSGVKME